MVNNQHTVDYSLFSFFVVHNSGDLYNTDEAFATEYLFFVQNLII